MPSRKSLYPSRMTNRRTRLKPPCHCETSSQTGRGNPHPLCIARKRTSAIRRSGFPRRFAPRNDRGVLYVALSFPNRHFLQNGDPSVANATAPLRGAPRARCNPLAPVRNLCRAALPLLGEVARQRRRGLQSNGTSRVEKNERNKNNLSLRSQFANWLWQSAAPNAARKHSAAIRRSGFPRRFAPRNDRGFLCIALPFTQWQ